MWGSAAIKISIRAGKAAIISTVDFGPQPLAWPSAPQWVGTTSGREP